MGTRGENGFRTEVPFAVGQVRRLCGDYGDSDEADAVSSLVSPTLASLSGDSGGAPWIPPQEMTGYEYKALHPTAQSQSSAQGLLLGDALPQHNAGAGKTMAVRLGVEDSPIS